MERRARRPRATSVLARIGAAQIGTARIGAARIGAARIGAARIDAARIGAARIDAARIDLPRAIVDASLRVLVALATIVPALTRQRDERAVVEGPPDADVVLDGVEAARDLLVAGDTAWKEGRREAAFDAWRSAIVASAAGGGTVVAPPLGPGSDVDGTLARRAEDGATAVVRRLAQISASDREAWTARFDALADIERAAAGEVPELLARVEREFPRTRAAARAALALADQAGERGERAAARAWIERAAEHAISGADLAAAFETRRRASSDPRAAESDPRDERGALTLELERVVELGPAESQRDVAIPGIAVVEHAPGTTTWFHGGGRLLAFDDAGRATAALDVREQLRVAGVTTLPTFSEPLAPWDDAIAADATTLALVAGRAREDRGNALVGVDAQSGARIAWFRDSTGLVQRGVRVAAPEIAQVPALLEFQPGPQLVADLLVVHVRAWPRAAEGATELDEARVESWCAGIDARDGTLAWSRRLATGATARGADRGRMSAREPTALPALPPVVVGSRVAIDTGLGAIAVVDAVDGRVVSIVRTSRRGARALPTGGIVASAAEQPACWFVPASADGALLRLRAEPDRDGAGLFVAAPLVLEGPRIPVGASGSRWLAIASSARGACIERQDLDRGTLARSVEIPGSSIERGSVAVVPLGDATIAASAGRALLLDAGLRLRVDLAIGPRAAYVPVSIARSDARLARTTAKTSIRIAGANRIAFLAGN